MKKIFTVLGCLVILGLSPVRGHADPIVLPAITVQISLGDFPVMLLTGKTLPEYAWSEVGEKYDDITPSLDQGPGEYAFNVTFVVRLAGVNAPMNHTGTIIKEEEDESFEEAFERHFTSGDLPKNITVGSPVEGGLRVVGTYNAPNGGFCIYGTCSGSNYVCELSDSQQYCAVFATPPTLSYYFESFQGCPPGCGHSPYMVSWAATNATTYEAQIRYYTSWYPLYSGSTAEVLAATGTQYPEDIRVRAVNSFGASAWGYMTLHVQCSEYQDPW